MTINNKDSKNNNVKLLRKAFDKYPKDIQVQMKKEYALIIRDINKPRNLQETYECYVQIIKKLSPKDRTITYYGIPIRLSYKQFACLYLALIEGIVDCIAYNELNFSYKKPTENAYESNLKPFVSKWHDKIFKQITKQESEYFSGKSKKFIKKTIENIIFYKKDYMNNYALYSNFTISKLVKKSQNTNTKEDSKQYV